MTFSVHTFQTGAADQSRGFAFHETLNEGQELYFLGKFPEDATEPRAAAEAVFGALMDSLSVSSGTPDVYDRFENALKAANMEARKWSKHMPSHPDVVVAFFDFQNLFLSQTGVSEAYLIREGTLSQITDPSSDDDAWFANVLAGQAAVDDTVLLSSENLIPHCPSTKLGELLSRENFDEAVRMLRHALSADENVSVVVTAIGVGKKSSNAGFLNKVVSKISTPKTEPATGDPIEDPIEEEIVEEVAPELPLDEPVVEVIEETEIVDVVEDHPEDDDADEIFEEEIAPEVEEYEEEDEYAAEPRERSLPKIPFQLPPRKNLMVIAGAVLGVLLLVIGISAISNYESAETSSMRERLAEGREAFQQADLFLSQGDRASAQEVLTLAETAAQEVMNSKTKDFRSDAQFLLADIQGKKLQVENARKVQAQVLADLATKNDKPNATGLVAVRGNLYAYDSGNVFKTVRNIVEKGQTISEKEKVLGAAAREVQNTIVFLTDGPRIIEYRDGVITPVTTQDPVWKAGIDVKNYGSNYTYVLDPVENQIWKYQRYTGQYSGATAYNNGTDLSQAVSMTIDGAIYIISSDGTLQKLFRGEKEDYAFREIPSVPFSGPKLKIYTTGELEFLYVLDPDNSRVLVFSKGDRFATYKKQVIFDVDDARDFSVDETGQKANIVTDSKIYEFAL